MMGNVCTYGSKRFCREERIEKCLALLQRGYFKINREITDRLGMQLTDEEIFKEYKVNLWMVIFQEAELEFRGKYKFNLYDKQLVIIDLTKKTGKEIVFDGREHYIQKNFFTTFFPEVRKELESTAAKVLG